MRDMTPGDFSPAFGFDYESWAPNTIIELLNVPWASDYQDVVAFPNAAAKRAWFDNQSTKVTSTSRKTVYCRPGEPVRLNIPFTNANHFNYMRVRQSQPHVGEETNFDMFYFIQDVRHIAPSVTEFSIMIDAFMTFGDKVSLGRMYVEQGHVGIAQENNFTNYGRTYLMEPEGFEMGAEMLTVSAKSAPIADKRGVVSDSNSTFDILVWSNTKLQGDWGTVSKPNMNMSSGSNFQGLPQSATCYIFKTVLDFTRFVNHVSQAPWIAQGILAVHVVPEGLLAEYAIREESYKLGNVTGTVKRLDNASVVMKDITIDNDIRGQVKEKLGERYKHLNKFLTAPYSMVELTTYTGTPVMLRPECIPSKDLTVRRMADLSLPSPRVVLTPTTYNGTNSAPPMKTVGHVDSYDNVESDFLDAQTGIYNFPTLSILNNNYLAYMSSNAHSIAFQHSSADWSQNKALAGNQLSFDQSSAGIALNSQMNSLNNQQSMIGTGIGVAGGILGSAKMGPAGMAMGAAGQAANVANTANSVVHNNMRTSATNANSAYVRDTNKAYADFAARGDFAQSIAAINAKSQDMRVVAPTTIGQVGGDQFALLYLSWSVFAKVKFVQESAMRAIGDYWLRYGYRINRFVKLGGRGIDRLNVMAKFSYWRCSEVQIQSSMCPELYRNTIKGILAKGVTVWSNPDNIFSADLRDGNDPIPGFYIF